MLGIEPSVFAYPCGHTWVGEGTSARSLIPLITEMFGAGRTFNDIAANSPADLDRAQIACVNTDGHTLATLLPILESAVAQGGWLVLGGHEIGIADGSETTLVQTIEAVVGWCRGNGVWINTIGSVARAAASVADRGTFARRRR
jgi:hypothetical protein